MSLFHYTDAGAVMSILEHQKIWMTDMRFLNDSKEYHDGVEFVQNSIKKIDIDDSQHHTQTAGAYLRGLNLELFSRELEQNPKFICSFSQAGDLLSQWRSYGYYAVEFDRAKLARNLNLVDCVYCDEQKKRQSQQVVEGIFKDFTGGAKASAVPGPGSVEAATGKLISLCLVFKSNHFREESEVRSFVSKYLYSQEIHYRVKGGHVIPYIPFEFSVDCIKAIHIGPIANQKLAEESMKMLVGRFRDKCRSEGKGDISIDVVCSDVPYRPL